MNQSQNNLVNVFEPNGIKWMLNEAFSISIAHFKFFATLVAIIQIPTIIFSFCFFGLTGEESKYDIGLTIIGYLITFFAFVLTISVITAAAGQHYTQNKVTLSFCFKRTWWRILSLTTGSTLITLGFLLISIPILIIFGLLAGIIGMNQSTIELLGLFMGIVLIIVGLFTCINLFIQTVIIEGVNLSGGLKRSIFLLKGKALKLFGGFTILLLMALGLSVIINVPFALLGLPQLDSRFSIENSNSTMLYYLIAFLKTFVDSIIVYPILITAGTLLYFDIRSDKENYDINKLQDDINISSQNLKLQQ